MAVLEFILIVLLQFEGVSGGRLYHRVGDDAVLPCSSGGSLSSCSGLGWFYIRDGDSRWVVQNGIVLPISPQAARLSLSRNCSLIINNITAEDAGRYTCRLGGSRSNTDEYLNVLSISPSDVGPTEDGDVTLHCSLRSYFSYCPENSLLWVDETGTQLTAEGDGYKVRGQTDCVSSLTVKHQNGRNRRFSCRFVERDRVKIEAHYTSVSAGQPQNVPPIIFIIIGAVVGLMVLLVVAAVLLIKIRRRTRVTEEQKNTSTGLVSDVQNPTHQSHPDVREDEDVVTYSAVRTRQKTEEDVDPSCLYSSISEPRSTRK